MSRLCKLVDPHQIGEVLREWDVFAAAYAAKLRTTNRLPEMQDQIKARRKSARLVQTANASNMACALAIATNKASISGSAAIPRATEDAIEEGIVATIDIPVECSLTNITLH